MRLTELNQITEFVPLSIPDHSLLPWKLDISDLANSSVVNVASDPDRSYASVSCSDKLNVKTALQDLLQADDVVNLAHTIEHEPSAVNCIDTSTTA